MILNTTFQRERRGHHRPSKATDSRLGRPAVGRVNAKGGPTAAEGTHVDVERRPEVWLPIRFQRFSTSSRLLRPPANRYTHASTILPSRPLTVTDTQWDNNGRTIDAADLCEALGLVEAMRSRVGSNDMQVHCSYRGLLPRKPHAPLEKRPPYTLVTQRASKDVRATSRHQCIGLDGKRTLLLGMSPMHPSVPRRRGRNRTHPPAIHLFCAQR